MTDGPNGTSITNFNGYIGTRSSCQITLATAMRLARLTILSGWIASVLHEVTICIQGEGGK